MTEETLKQRIDRHEAIRRTASLRAAIIAGMQDGELYRMDMIQGLDLVKQLSAKPKDIQNTVYRMVKMGLMNQQPLGTGVAYKRGIGSKSVLPVARKSKRPAVKSSSVKSVAAKTNPTIQVDVIKSTGRVRLTLGGLIIEVGVSNE